VKYSRHFLNKLEQVFEDLGYQVYYGKGNFNFGHCLVESEKKVVVNRFFDVEGRILGLLEILSEIEIDVEFLTPPSRKLIGKLRRDAILTSP
jgi:hypothetical protein